MSDRRDLASLINTVFYEIYIYYFLINIIKLSPFSILHSGLYQFIQNENPPYPSAQFRSLPPTSLLVIFLLLFLSVSLTVLFLARNIIINKTSFSSSSSCLNEWILKPFLATSIYYFLLFVPNCKVYKAYVVLVSHFQGISHMQITFIIT